jgi:predicted ATPase
LRQLAGWQEICLIRIAGTGGVGRTSLALQVAQDVRDAFTDGVFFISARTRTAMIEGGSREI